jgi:caffeoyl-CoA O-methyltransferase
MLTLVKPEIDEYVVAKSEPVPALLAELEEETKRTMPLAIMLTGALEGRFLKMMVALTGARRVLEIGMFTGYSALSMAEGLPEGGELITCEIDPKAIAVAQRYFARSEHGKKIKIKEGPALDSIKDLNGQFDLVFLDADKINYANYYEAVMPIVKAGGVILVDNVLYGGDVLDPKDENARAIASFNEKVLADTRVASVMLPVRDGVSIVRKK